MAPLLWAFLLCLLGPRAAAGQTVRQTSYGLFIEADVYTTVLYVYRWPTIVDDQTVPVISPQNMSSVSYTLKPGFPDLVANLSVIQDQLVNLIAVAKARVPADQYLGTPVYLSGRAGMRALSAAQSAAILQVATATLGNPALSPFKFSPAWATVSSGEQEASDAWAAVNILQNVIYGPVANTSAVLSLGAMTSQIAFATTTTPLSGAFTLRYANQLFSLYTHTYIGLGLTAGYQTYLQRLTAAYPGGAAPDACGFQNPPDANRQRLFNATANFTGCLAAVRQAFGFGAACPAGSCGVGNAYQPPVPAAMPVVLIGSYVPVITWLGCPANTTTDCILNRSTTLCSNQSYASMAQQFPALAADQSLYGFCFQAALVYISLNDGFKLPASRMLQAVDTIGGLQVSWSLGAMTKAIGSWNLNCTLNNTTPPPPPTVYSVILDLSVSGMVKQSVFRWDKKLDSNSIPVIQTLDVYQVAADALALRANTSLLSALLLPFWTRANASVPLSYTAATTVWVLFDPAVVVAASDAAAFTAALPGFTVQLSSLAGEAQAASLWVAANVAGGTMAAAGTVPTIALEARAASVAFVPATTPPVAGHYQLEFDGQAWQLYAQRFRGFGLADLMEQYYRGLSVWGNVSDPCRYSGTNYSSPVAPGYVFPGASNFSACLAAVSALLNLNQTCAALPCSLAGMYQPPIPAGPVVLAGVFQSYFGFLNCTGPDALTCVQAAAPGECNRPYNTSNAKALGADPGSCFAVAVAQQLLAGAFRLTSSHLLRFVNDSTSNSAVGLAVIQDGLTNIRPEPCYRSYATVEALGILDPPDVLTLSWINATATVLPVPTNLTTTVRLLGLWVSRNLTISVKLASTFWDCLGTAPGSSSAGTVLDWTTKMAVVGPVSLAGDYRVCFKHNKDWQLTPVVVSVQDAPMTNVIYFGAATCDDALQRYPQYCGCYYLKPDWSRTRALMTSGVPMYNRPTSVPSILIKNVRGNVNVVQGCCQLPVKYMDGFQEGTNDYWGMCKLTAS